MSSRLTRLFGPEAKRAYSQPWARPTPTLRPTITPTIDAIKAGRLPLHKGGCGHGDYDPAPQPWSWFALLWFVFQCVCAGLGLLAIGMVLAR